MLRNLLYSIFCHFIFLVCIYFSNSSLTSYTTLTITKQNDTKMAHTKTTGGGNKKRQFVKHTGIASTPSAESPTIEPPTGWLNPVDIHPRVGLASSQELSINPHRFVPLDPEAVPQKPKSMPKEIANDQDIVALVKSVQQKDQQYQKMEQALEEIYSGKSIALRDQRRQELQQQKLAEAEAAKLPPVKPEPPKNSEPPKGSDPIPDDPPSSSTELTQETNTLEDVLDPNEGGEDIFGGNELGTLEGPPKRDLSVRDKIQLQTQLVNCYKRAIKYTKHNSQIVMMVRVDVNRDGTMLINRAKIGPENPRTPRTGPIYEMALENAKMALVYCNPLRNLPKEKYSLWRHLSFSFDVETQPLVDD